MIKLRYMATMAAVAALLAASPALAVDFTAPLNQLDGHPFVGPDGKDVATTLGSVAETALLSAYQDEPNLSPEDKVKRFALAEKIHLHPTDAQLTAEDVALIKKLVGKSFNALIVGEAWRLLDPASVPK